jgi:hypothetical protein
LKKAVALNRLRWSILTILDRMGLVTEQTASRIGSVDMMAAASVAWGRRKESDKPAATAGRLLLG